MIDYHAEASGRVGGQVAVIGVLRRRSGLCWLLVSERLAVNQERLQRAEQPFGTA
jgi:hypothetical protein